MSFMDAIEDTGPEPKVEELPPLMPKLPYRLIQTIDFGEDGKIIYHSLERIPFKKEKLNV